MHRRDFLFKSASGLSTLALGTLLAGNKIAHFAPRAKSVIYLYMSGGPSQMDLMDHKPLLSKHDGQDAPKEFMEGKRFAFIKGIPKLGGTRWKFAKRGQCGTQISDLLPGLSSVIDDVTVINSMHTEQFNHDPAATLMMTGSAISGRPGMGSWLSYGLGSENENLPAFVSMVSGQGSQPVQSRLWSSGFLPSNFQGVQFRSLGDAVLSVNNPAGIDARGREESVKAINELNRLHHQRVIDPEIITRIKSYELAYNMQTSVPELMDISSEPDDIHKLYGTQPGKKAFANNCLLARRLVERGVRFVQLSHTGWDHHGGGKRNLIKDLPLECRQTDQSSAALIADLKQRGMLDETLVVWGGEFGRTPMAQGKTSKDNMGRDHNPFGFSVWLAGGGVKGGGVHGATDDFGYEAVEDKASVFDLQATILHCMGIDHEKLTYRFQGRDFRLTDVFGAPIKKILR
jgi:hypothetical protein